MSDELSDSSPLEDSQQDSPRDQYDDLLDGSPQTSTPLESTPVAQPEPDRYDALLDGATPKSLSAPDVHAQLSALNHIPPEQASRVDALSKSAGVPFSVAMDNQKDFEHVDEVKKLIDSLSETNENGLPKFPNTIETLSDPVKLAKWRDRVDQLKAIESIIQQHTPVPLINKINEPYANLRRSAAKVVTQIPAGLAVLNNALFPNGLPLEQLTPAEVQSQNPKLSLEEAKAKADEINALGWQKRRVEDDPLYKFSKAMDEHVEKSFPTDPRLQNSFLLNKVPGVVGMTGGFLATGGLGEIAGASHTVNAAVALTTTAAGAYDEAKAHPGTTDDQAMKAALLTAPTGLLYTIVPHAMLARLFGTAGGKASTSIIKSALVEGGTATVLFPAQGGLSNAVAKNVYDKDRGYWDGQLQQGLSGGVGSTIASIIISAATGGHVPAVQNKQAPHPEVADMVQEHLASTQAEVARIKDQDAKISLLENLQKEVAPESKGEGAPQAPRDANDVSDHIQSTLEANNQPTEMDVDPDVIHEAFFQGAKTPADVEAAQGKFDQFIEEVGVNKAIQKGVPLKINTAKLIGIYGTDPIFKAITDQMKAERDTAHENVTQKQSDFEKSVEAKQKQFAEPTQVKALRDQMMKSVDEGGGGKSAQEVDDDLKAILTPLGNIARQRGETLQEAFDRSGLEVKTGEDGRVFVQRLQGGSAPSAVPEDRIKATLESAVEEGRPVSKALADRLGLDIPENYIDYGGFYAKEVKGKTLTEDERVTLERQAGEEAAAMQQADLSGQTELLDAVMGLGGIPTASNERGASGLGGEIDAIREAAKKSPKYFRKNALSLDKLLEKLNEQGFKFETPADLATAIYDRINQGHKVFAGSNDALFQADKAAIPGAIPEASDVKTILDRLGISEVDFQHELGIPIKKLTAKQAREIALETSLTGVEGVRDFLVALRQKEKRAGDKAIQPDAPRIESPRFDPLGQKEDNTAQLSWIDGLAKNVDKLPGGAAQLLTEKPDVFNKYREEWRTFNPRADENGHLLYAGDENNPRGAFHPISGKDVIHLFKTHDASTFLHEAHHFIVKEYQSLVDSGLADAQTLKDWNTLLEFVGSKDGKLTREMHEKLADAGVTYYMEGKAPSPGLIDVFRRFKDRLLQLYKHADGLGVKLSDDVRSVFARWHASETEINQANEFYHLQDVIKNLNDPGFKQKQVEAKLEKKSAAHEIAMKEAKRKSATLDVDGQPVYRLLNNDKLSLESVKEEFGETTANELKAKFPEAFDENGSNVQELAIKHGFESPESVIDSLKQALPREEAIDQRLKELISSGENAVLSKEPTAVTPADSETHTQQTMDLLIDDTNRMIEEASHQTGKDATQARMANARKGSKANHLTAKAYRDVARDTLNKMISGEAAEYYRFAQAEKRFAAEMVRHLQKGNSKEALAASMKRLHNHAMVLESIKARAEIEKIQGHYEFKRIGKLLKEGIENEFVSPITTLLSRFGFSNKKPAIPYDFTKITEIDPVLAAMVPDVVKGQASGDYRKVLTLEQLREVDKFASTLFHVGRDVMRSIKEGQEMSIAKFVADSVSNMANLKDKPLAQEGSKKAWVQKFLSVVSSSTIQQQFLADMVDNFSLRKDGKIGVMRKLYQTMVDRQVHEAEMQKDIAKELTAHFKTLQGASDRITKERGTYFDHEELPLPPELNKVYRGKWTAERLIALMLNTGNEGNLASLANAYAYREEHIASAAKFFKADELKAIQGIWDVINKLYPHIDKAHFEAYNRHVEKVEGKEATYKDKDGNDVTLAGGYYPLKFDSEINTQAGKNAEQDLMEQYAGVLRSSKPQDGFTQSRTPGHSLPPLLSLSVLGRHIAETIHYATHADIVRDYNRVTSNEEWKRVFTDKFGTKNYEETRQWLKDQAQKAPPLPIGAFSRVLENFFQKQRAIATVAAFGMNVKSGVLIHHSLLNAGHALEWKWLGSGMRDMDLKTAAGLSSGQAWKEIADLSPYMKDHALSWDRDVRAMSEDLKPQGVGRLDRILRKASAAMGKEFTLGDARKASMILLTTGHQRMAAIVWKGALNKYMSTIADSKLPHEENMKNAVKYADAMVQDTQASSLRAELNAVQRDQGIMKFMTAFMSWNFKYGGRLQYEAKAFKEGKISKGDYISHVVYETLAPALVRTSLIGLMTASAPSAWDWMKSVPEMITSWVPILKDLPKVFPYSQKQKRVSLDVGAALPITEGGRRVVKAMNSSLQVARGTKEAGPMLWDWARATDYITGTGVTKPAQDLYRFYENANKEEK
jgi:hypothetical protein